MDRIADISVIESLQKQHNQSIVVHNKYNSVCSVKRVKNAGSDMNQLLRGLHGKTNSTGATQCLSLTNGLSYLNRYDWIGAQQQYENKYKDALARLEIYKNKIRSDAALDWNAKKLKLSDFRKEINSELKALADELYKDYFDYYNASVGDNVSYNPALLSEKQFKRKLNDAAIDGVRYDALVAGVNQEREDEQKRRAETQANMDVACGSLYGGADKIVDLIRKETAALWASALADVWVLPKTGVKSAEELRRNSSADKKARKNKELNRVEVDEDGNPREQYEPPAWSLGWKLSEALEGIRYDKNHGKKPCVSQTEKEFLSVVDNAFMHVIDTLYILCEKGKKELQAGEVDKTQQEKLDEAYAAYRAHYEKQRTAIKENIKREFASRK